MAGSSMIGNLAVSLSLQTAAFQAGAKQVETRAKVMQARLGGIGKSISGFGAALGLGIGVAAITNIARNAFDMAAALDESAQKMGVTVEALQELNLAAEQSGVSQETLSTAMSRLNKSMGALVQGSPPAVAAFAKLGLAAEDLKGKSPDQALRLIADALNKLPSVQERVAVGSAIMGKGFSQLLPLINGGSAALDKYAETSRRNGQISTEDAKKLDELADSWERLKVRVGVATANMIAGFAKFAAKLDEGVIKWWAFRDRVIEAVSQMAIRAVALVNDMVSGIAHAIINRLNAIWEGAKAKIESVKNAFKNMYDAVVGNSYVPDMVQGIADSMSQLQRVLVDPAISATEKVGATFQALAGIIGDLFGSKAGSIVGAIGNFAMAIAPLFGGAKAPTQGFVGPPGMARGGSGVFGGRGGVDRNLLSLNGSPIARVSRGEHFSVSPDSQSMARVQIIPSPYFDVVVDRRAQRVAAPMAGQAAMAGAGGATQMMARRDRQTIR